MNLEAVMTEVASALPLGVLVSVAGPSVTPPGLWTARIGGHSSVAETPLKAMLEVETAWRACHADEWRHETPAGPLIR